MYCCQAFSVCGFLQPTFSTSCGTRYLLLHIVVNDFRSPLLYRSYLGLHKNISNSMTVKWDVSGFINLYLGNCCCGAGCARPAHQHFAVREAEEELDRLHVPPAAPLRLSSVSAAAPLTATATHSATQTIDHCLMLNNNLTLFYLYLRWMVLQPNKVFWFWLETGITVNAVVVFAPHTRSPHSSCQLSPPSQRCRCT